MARSQIASGVGSFPRGSLPTLTTGLRLGQPQHGTPEIMAVGGGTSDPGGRYHGGPARTGIKQTAVSLASSKRIKNSAGAAKRSLRPIRRPLVAIENEVGRDVDERGCHAVAARHGKQRWLLRHKRQTRRSRSASAPIDRVWRPALTIADGFEPRPKTRSIPLRFQDPRSGRRLPHRQVASRTGQSRKDTEPTGPLLARTRSVFLPVMISMLHFRRDEARSA